MKRLFLMVLNRLILVLSTPLVLFNVLIALIILVKDWSLRITNNEFNV